MYYLCFSVWCVSVFALPYIVDRMRRKLKSWVSKLKPVGQIWPFFFFFLMILEVRRIFIFKMLEKQTKKYGAGLVYVDL